MTHVSAQRQRLPQGGWHFHHGPMDLIVQADGEPQAVSAAHEDAWRIFVPLLGTLVAELALLRQPVGQACALQGEVARHMWRACQPHRHGFITPMAAVAGAVADHVITAYRRPGVQRAWVNNGGDIALHLCPGTQVRVGLYADPARLDLSQLLHGLMLDGQLLVSAQHRVRGVATSGWGGRSLSLGIADAVTVLAADAATADAAATVIANAVDVQAGGIERRPACDVQDDSDLGERLVTVAVPRLHPALVQRALTAGERRARVLQARGLITAALLSCQGQQRAVGPSNLAHLRCASPTPPVLPLPAASPETALLVR